jgi:hypothetical protein
VFHGISIEALGPILVQPVIVLEAHLVARQWEESGIDSTPSYQYPKIEPDV